MHEGCLRRADTNGFLCVGMPSPLTALHRRSLFVSFGSLITYIVAPDFGFFAASASSRVHCLKYVLPSDWMKHVKFFFSQT